MSRRNNTLLTVDFNLRTNNEVLSMLRSRRGQNLVERDHTASRRPAGTFNDRYKPLKNNQLDFSFILWGTN